MAFLGFTVTMAGLEYITKATAGKKLVFTRGAFGNGALPEGASASAITELISPLGPLPISKQVVKNGVAITTTQFSNRVSGSILPEFHLMEVALFGKIQNADGTDDPTSPEAIIIYANERTNENADKIPAVLTEFLINFRLSIKSSQNVACIIDESLVYPTLEDFNGRTPYQVTAGGTGAAITLDIPELIQLKDGTTVMVKLTADMQDNATVSCNGGTYYPLKNLDGSEAQEGAIAGTYVMIVFSADDQCWYLIGDGGAGASGGDTLVFFDSVVAVADWVADTTYAAYPYKADVACALVTTDYAPEVVFDVPEATIGRYAPVAKSGTDIVTIYAKKVPTAAITIPLITCARVVAEE